MLETNDPPLAIITSDVILKNECEKPIREDSQVLSPTNYASKPPRAQSISPRPENKEFLSSGIRYRSTRRTGVPPMSGRIRSASAGRSPKNDLRARYWAFLFDNLHRAVDEIYQTCEMDESVVECKESILMLENYSKEFCALAQWLKLSKELEDKPSPNRPSSLSWEVRKSSPGKCIVRSAFMNYILTNQSRSGLNLNTFKNNISTAVQTEDLQVVFDSDVVTTPDKDLRLKDDTPEIPKSSLLVVESQTDQKPNVETSSCTTEITCTEKGTKDIDVPNVSEQSVCELEKVDPLDLKSREEKVPELLVPSEEVILTASTTTKASSAEKSYAVVVNNHTKSQSPNSKLTSSRPSANVKEINNSFASKVSSSESAESQKSNTGTSVTTRTDSIVSTSDIQEKKETLSGSVTLVKKYPSVRKTTADVVTSFRDKKVPDIVAACPKERKHEGITFKEKRLALKPLNVAQQDFRRTPSAQAVRGRRPAYVRPRAAALETRKPATTYIPTKPKTDPQKYQAHPTTTRPYAFQQDNIHKTESMSSISSSSSGQSWADKVKGSLEVLQSKSLDDLKIANEDDEGWETVHRGRTRGRNSPAKKMQPTAASVGNLTQLPQTERRPNFSQSKVLEPERKASSKLPMGEAHRATRTGSTVKATTMVRPKLAERSANKDKDAPGRNKISSGVEQRQEENESSCKLENVEGQDGSELMEDVAGLPERNVDDEGVGSAFDDSIVDSIKNNAAIESENVIVEHCDDNVEIDKKDVHENAESRSVNVEPCDDDVDDSRIDSESTSLSLTSDSSDSEREDEDEEVDLFEQMLSKDLEHDWNELLSIEVQEQVHEMGLSWGDEMDRLEQELHRTPGRALQVHEKLSSPYKKRSPSETIRRHEEKLAKAQEQRERLLEEKAQKCKNILKKAEEMRAWKEEQQQQKRAEMEKKLQRAEEKRRMQLQKIVRKAHDEEEKVNEIAFINTLEAQNKRHDILSKEKDREVRLQDRQKEQLRKQEEKAAKEAAAEERRKVLEAERQARLQEMQEKRKIKDKKIEQQLQEKEKERQEAATQKARDREQRLSALNAAQQANLEELQKKIQQKQEDSARRHEENMLSIRQKAFELSVRQCSSNNDDAPRVTPYETKKICTLCNVWIASEVYLLSHLRGRKHQEAVREQHQGEEPPTEELELYNIRHIVDASADKMDPEITLDKERQKALKKRCKKIRQRMINKGEMYEKMSTEKTANVSTTYKQKFQKGIKDVDKSIAALAAGSWESGNLTTLERALGELERVLEKSSSFEKEAFCCLRGLFITNQLLKLATNCKPDLVPIKSLVRICRVWQLACENSRGNCSHVMCSNQITALLDLLVLRLHGLLPPTGQLLPLPLDPLAGALMRLLAGVMIGLTNNDDGSDDADARQRVLDVISYTVSVGIVDKLSRYLSTVRSSVDAEPRAADFILQIVSFLTALAKLLSNNRQRCIVEGKNVDDGTHLVTTFRVTELVGTVSFLYGALLHSGATSPPPELPPHTLVLTTTALRLLNGLAVLDLQLLQSVLASEGLSLQLRHIASYLLGYCGHWNVQPLLHEVVLLIGYFTVLHPDNQGVIQSGQRPTILQQLCALPFAYFSDPERMVILFPTLICCCFRNDHNTAILEQELSPELLANYLEGCLLDVYRDAVPRGKKESIEEEVRWNLAARFPKEKWTSAKQYFSV